MKSPTFLRAPLNAAAPNPRRGRRRRAVKNRLKRLWRSTKVRARKVRGEVKFLRYLLQRLKVVNDWCKKYCVCWQKAKEETDDERRAKDKGKGRGAWVLRGIKKALGMAGGGLQRLGGWGMKGLQRIFQR